MRNLDEFVQVWGEIWFLKGDCGVRRVVDERAVFILRETIAIFKIGFSEPSSEYY